MKGTYQGMEGYYAAQVEEQAAREAEKWHVVDDQAVWPAERWRAEKGNRDFRIICDPAAEHIRFPEHASGEWWALVVREKHGGVFEYLHFGAYRSPGEAAVAAEKLWAGPEQE